jgi:rhodanese-related sulfurtransferase
MLSILAVTLMVSSCKKEEAVNESLVLVQYLESAESPLMKDYVNTDMPSIMAASEVKTLNETGQVYIVDVRAAADFALGHIANAHNVALADILTHVKGVDLTPYTKIAVVCYTGQTAGFATSLLRIMGYDKAFSMKWGMCSWNADFAAKWKNTVAAGNAYASQFTATATEKNAAGELPTLTTGKTTGQEILEARVNALLVEGFTPATVTNKAVFDNLAGYYIVNYWPVAHYNAPGHIPGAVQYEPKASIKLDAALKTLPIDKPVVVYCYSGQTSAFMAAYLRLLGYDAKSLLYGANGMIYDQMVTAKLTTFNDAQIMGYEYVK